MHLKHLAKEAHPKQQDSSLKNWGVKAAVGAGIGATGCIAGMAIVPALGMKALLGHLIAAKVAGAGSAVGAGTTIALQFRNKSAKQQKSRAAKKHSQPKRSPRQHKTEKLPA